MAEDASIEPKESAPKNEVEKKPPDAATGLVRKLQNSYASALPSHIAQEQFSRSLLTAFRRTPKLLNCTKESVASAVLDAAQLGLMIGVNGSCWLIPYGDEATLVIGYQGMIDLCYRSGQVESIIADVVYENDFFEFEQGLDQKLKHIPLMHGDRGKPFAAYAIANVKGSSRPVFVVLSEQEIEAVRNASPGSKSKDSPWNGVFRTEMWKKTAFNRLQKYLPKSVEIQQVLTFEQIQHERFRDVEVEVVDDSDSLLQPGRHSTRKG